MIDPLADDYNWQTPYAFSENRVIDGFELEGLERVSFLAVGAFQGNDYAVGAVYDIDTNNVKAGISVGTDKGPFNLLLNYNIDESKTSVSTPNYLDVAGDIKEMNKGSKVSSSLINLVDNIGIFNMDNIAKDAQSNINNAFIEAGLSINDANTLTELIVGNITTIVNDIQNGKADLLYSKENDTYKQVTGENGQKQLYKFSDGSSWTVRYNNSNNSVQFIRYTDYDKKENQENGN